MANEALPTARRSASAAGGSLNAGRFRNWKILAFELAVGLLGFCFFSVIIATSTGGLMIAGIVCFIAGIAALLLFWCELLGISIDSETLTMPTRQIPSIPAISFRRRTVMLSEVRRLTLSARWFGFEVAKISGDFGWDILVFASRRQRRRFTSLIQSICPGVAIYRIRSISEASVRFAPSHGSEIEPRLG